MSFRRGVLQTFFWENGMLIEKTYDYDLLNSISKKYH